MKKLFVILTVVIVVSLAISAVSAQENIKGLNISSDLNHTLNDAKIENKSVLVVFTQDSCQYCDMFDKDVLSDSEVQKELNKTCKVVFIDINKDSSTAARYNVFGTPASVFIDSNGSEIERIEGYVDAGQFLNTLRGI